MLGPVIKGALPSEDPDPRSDNRLLVTREGKSGHLCIKCARGFCLECGSCPCCKGEISEFEVPVSAEKTRFSKSSDELRDPKSTGRKRAAELYPLIPDAPCEWRGQKNCGGGRFPIVGCLNGIQTNRHHGPDKDTTNNSSGNLHRICAKCHQRWHWLNDYLPPHKPEKATPAEIAQSEMNWATPGYAKSIAGGTKLDKTGDKEGSLDD